MPALLKYGRRYWIAAGAENWTSGLSTLRYTINGKKYATYLPSMTGVKEETTGKNYLNIKDVDTKTYYQTIDFNNQPDGSRSLVILKNYKFEK